MHFGEKGGLPEYDDYGDGTRMIEAGAAEAADHPEQAADKIFLQKNVEGNDNDEPPDEEPSE